MRCFLIPLFSVFALFAEAQNGFERKGFFFGGAFGASRVSLSASAASGFPQAGLSAPNLKFGRMISPKTGAAVLLLGSVYRQDWSGRVRDRGFEGIVPSLQFWPKSRWWLLGGAGLGMDAPAFYDIKDATERKFHFGAAAAIGTGWEVFRRGRFALDMQARAHFGRIGAPEGQRDGSAFSLLLGLNWY